MRFSTSCLLVLLLAVLVTPLSARQFLTEPGEPLPNFDATVATGDALVISPDTKVTILHVFDCESELCAESLSSVERHLWKPYQKLNVQVIGIGRDAGPEEVKAITAENGLTFPMVPDPDRVIAGLFAEGGSGVPRTIVTDKDLNIVYQHAGWRAGREAELLRVTQSLLADRPLPRVRAKGSGAQNPAAPRMAAPWVGKDAPEVHVEEWITTAPPDAEGKYTMIEFWATWCAPCVAIMPHLDEVAKTHSDKLVIKSISNESPAKVKAFVERKGFTYPIGVDAKSRTASTVGVRGIPHGLLVNPEGKVVWQGHPGEFVGEAGEKKLEKFLDGEKV